jgi:hypothetical protein
MVASGMTNEWGLQKAITGGPSSTRHKLSDPFPGARTEARGSRTQLLRARTGKHRPQMPLPAFTFHAAPVMAVIPVRREPKMADLPQA